MGPPSNRCGFEPYAPVPQTLHVQGNEGSLDCWAGSSRHVCHQQCIQALSCNICSTLFHHTPKCTSTAWTSLQVICMALEDAQLAAASMACLEMHGTGTPLGDPIEVGAVAAVFGAVQARPDQAPLCLGAVKSALGHTEPAAGATGMARSLLRCAFCLIWPHAESVQDKAVYHISCQTTGISHAVPLVPVTECMQDQEAGTSVMLPGHWYTLCNRCYALCRHMPHFLGANLSCVAARLLFIP